MVAAAMKGSLNATFKRLFPNIRPHWKAARWTALYTVEAVFILHALTKYTYEIRVPYGISMTPTLASEGEVIVIDKTYRRGRNVKVGDIVAFKHPVAESQAIKRVIGMPGDFVLAGTPEIRGGPLADKMLQIPKGHCFVAGDNQEWSRDSRVFGPLPLPLILGRVTFVAWPLSSFGFPRNGIHDYKVDGESDLD